MNEPFPHSSPNEVQLISLMFSKRNKDISNKSNAKYFQCSFEKSEQSYVSKEINAYVRKGLQEQDVCPSQTIKRRFHSWETDLFLLLRSLTFVRRRLGRGCRAAVRSRTLCPQPCFQPCRKSSRRRWWPRTPAPPRPTQRHSSHVSPAVNRQRAQTMGCRLRKGGEAT